jgi:hypothetical protein
MIKNTLHDHKRGVRATYTEQELTSILWGLKLKGMSLRAIAQELFDGQVTHAVIQRGLKGEFPTNEHKRHILSLPALIPAPACLKCGEVHVAKRCMNGGAGRKTPRRVAIRCDSMISAAGTILRNLEPEQVKELVRLLEVRDDGKQLS